jgi:GNAT superfamily N-acetyltransferase
MLRIGRPETAEELDEYFELRWRALRAPWGQPPGSERDEHEDAAHHVTAKLPSGQLAGIGRLHRTGAAEAQIRYMATEAQYRGRGVGGAILSRLEALARADGARRIVLNARDGAVGFYARRGYSVVGLGPTLFGRIMHSAMEKTLDPR